MRLLKKSGNVTTSTPELLCIPLECIKLAGPTGVRFVSSNHLAFFHRGLRLFLETDIHETAAVPPLELKTNTAFRPCILCIMFVE